MKKIKFINEEYMTIEEALKIFEKKKRNLMVNGMALVFQEDGGYKIEAYLSNLLACLMAIEALEMAKEIKEGINCD